MSVIVINTGLGDKASSHQYALGWPEAKGKFQTAGVYKTLRDSSRHLKIFSLITQTRAKNSDFQLRNLEKNYLSFVTHRQKRDASCILLFFYSGYLSLNHLYEQLTAPHPGKRLDTSLYSGQVYKKSHDF
ncbi:uncharacterized protein H6S33_009987 [Morchella sextelata]|uniref:uncharacterized protein n=1 Tax=Morchella sextelata TaxID=1174677 RepID=UPI001D03DCF6|nr:uncharacterized protein H6S33_009987 [Morchella sextelata]KAH0611935.1 hypothetical protein H6S33_009987 [Morchella sextelata]